MGSFLSLREKIRLKPWIARSVYLAQSLVHSNFGRLVRHQPRDLHSQKNETRRDHFPFEAKNNLAGVALCLRFRDEAPYLAEWLEYYLVAGVEHFFLYNNYSTDDYRSVLDDFISRGLVTLVEWPRTPASPSAEEDCILRTTGKFQWVGFLDADEFVVIRDGRSIGEFLASYSEYPSVGLA